MLSRYLTMGPRERAAQRVLDEMPADERAKLTREQGGALSDAVWDARARDRRERRGHER